MSIQAITQFEVYVLEHGRWTLHARYPGAERDDALLDARRTEHNTGLPTKVTRETYYPDENHSEEVTVYVSRHAKKQLKRGKDAKRAGVTGNKSASFAKGRAYAPLGSLPAVSDAFFFSRLFLALGLSLGLAAGLTGFFALLLDALASLGARIPANIGARMTFYWYLAMFALSLLALNRTLVPWRQMLSQRFSKPSRQRSVELEPVALTDFKPKRPELLRETEAALAQQELKLSRGDLDVTVESQPAPAPKSEQPLIQSPEPKEVIAKERKEESNQSSETNDGDADQVETETEVQTLDKEAEDSDEDVATTALVGLEIERLIMMRFLGDAILAMRERQDHLDTMSRQGMSLFLAGATTALAGLRGLIPETEANILKEALVLIGHDEGSAETFLSELEENSKLSKNRELLAAGEQAMKQNLQTSHGTAGALGDVIKQWRESEYVSDVALGEIFLLTYVEPPNPNPTSADEESMNRHTGQVRKVCADCNGEEVRHTGKGIFARFDYPDAAIAAAISIQQDWDRLRTSESPPPPTCIALISSDPNKSDPAISGDVYSQADTLCRRLGKSQIACDVLIRDVCTKSDVHFGPKIPKAHSGIAERIDAVEVMWAPFSAAPETGS